MPYSAPAPGDVHVNRPLTNIAIAYMQDHANTFVADSVFPNVPVAKQSDAYFTFSRGEWNRDDVKERAPGTESAGGSFDIGQDTYFARVKAFHMDINDQMIANQDSPLSLDQQATMYVMSKHLLHRELGWANVYFKAGVWTFQVAGNAAATAKATLNPDTTTNGAANDKLLFWNNAASTPIEDLRWLMTFQQQRTGFRPNKLVLGRPVFDVLVDHPAIIARMDRGQTVGAAKANRAIIASLLELDEVVVMDGIVNSAAQGLAEANSFIGGKHAMLVYAPAVAGLMLPSAGYTFSWTGFLGASNQGVRMKRFYMDALESTRIEGQQAFVQKLVALDLAVFIKDVIQ
jgi:hypothetical protein